MYLEHVNMTVRDIDESVAFYCSLLGGVVSWRGTAVNMNETVSAAHVRLTSGYISMFECERGGSATYDYAPLGMNHIGFVVDDLAQTRSKLDSLGIKIESEADYSPGVRLYIFDPNGIELELVCYGPDEQTSPWSDGSEAN